jgi:hypothetical protein
MIYMTVITLTRFIVIAKHANTIHDESQTIFERMIRSRAPVAATAIEPIPQMSAYQVRVAGPKAA